MEAIMSAKGIVISLCLMAGGGYFVVLGGISRRAARRMKSGGGESAEVIGAVSRNAVFLVCVGALAIAFGAWMLAGALFPRS
jgi:hypothetical protein